jgi:hypothetical protein
MSFTPAITAESWMNSGLARARWPPEDERVQLATLQRLPQWLAGPDDLLLADEFIEAARPHAIRERSQAIVRRRIAQQIRLRTAGPATHCDARLSDSAAIHNGQRDTPR